MKQDDKHKAEKIIVHLEGTLIADIKSVRKWAANYNHKREPYKNCGGLNYSIFLLCLIGCETLGMYVFGARYHKKAEEDNNIPDVGAYIIEFIEKYFPSKNEFKKISKILADYLRHSLVHGFAPLHDNYPFDLNLVINENSIEEPIKTFEGKKLGIQLNGIAFADQVISTFKKRIKEVINNEKRGSDELVRNILQTD
ncbi:MAG: hypothetical protein ABFR82_07365, partial [Nitrospirota bacterium]